MMHKYFKIIPASYLIYRQDNKTLLQLRKNTGYQDGYYGLVSGHVEANESFTQGIIREAKEEADMIIDESMLKVVHILHRNTDNHENQRIDIFFELSNYSGTFKNNEPHKCAELSMFDQKNLPTNLMGYLKQVFDDIEKGVEFREINFRGVNY